jgi:hypothetical protein
MLSISQFQLARRYATVEGVKLGLAGLFDAAEVSRVDAEAAAAKEKEDVDAEWVEIRRGKSALDAVRAALGAEKAAMEKTYTFQTRKVLLNVGGVRFETSLPTLTSVRDTYLESIFSGRFKLATDPDGRGLHSSTFRLNLSASCGIGGAFRCCLGGVWEVSRGVRACSGCVLCQKRLRLS